MSKGFMFSERSLSGHCVESRPYRVRSETGRPVLMLFTKVQEKKRQLSGTRLWVVEAVKSGQINGEHEGGVTRTWGGAGCGNC